MMSNLQRETVSYELNAFLSVNNVKDLYISGKYDAYVSTSEFVGKATKCVCSVPHVRAGGIVAMTKRCTGDERSSNQPIAGMVWSGMMDARLPGVLLQHWFQTRNFNKTFE